MLNRSLEWGKFWSFAGCGAAGGALGAVVGEVVQRSAAGTFFTLLLVTAAWTALIAIGIAWALLGAQSYYLTRGFPRGRQIVIGGLGAVLAGSIAGFAAQLFFGLALLVLSTDSLAALIALEAVRVLAWALMGILLGIGLSRCIPNLGTVRGLVGGVVGATVGALGFVLLTYTLGDLLGRWLGAGIIGGCLGAVLTWIEMAFREAWLEVAYGPKETRRVSLGKQSVLLGSDRERCTVLVPNALPVALKYVLEGGQVHLEDLGQGQTVTIGPGDRRTLGTLTVTLRAISERGGPPAPDRQPPPATTAAAGQHAVTGYALRAGGRVLPLGEGARFTAQELGLRDGFPATAVCAEVVENPAQPGVYGMKNLTKIRWQAVLVSGEVRDVDPGKSIRLAKGTRVTIGQATLLIE